MPRGWLWGTGPGSERISHGGSTSSFCGSRRPASPGPGRATRGDRSPELGFGTEGPPPASPGRAGEPRPQPLPPQRPRPPPAGAAPSPPLQAGPYRFLRLPAGTRGRCRCPLRCRCRGRSRCGRPGPAVATRAALGPPRPQRPPAAGGAPGSARGESRLSRHGMKAALKKQLKNKRVPLEEVEKLPILRLKIQF